MPKLVAREAEYDQAPGSEAPLQVIHLGVVPHRGASERCYVLNEQHTCPAGGQVEGLPAGQRTRGEGVHRARGPPPPGRPPSAERRTWYEIQVESSELGT